jgi:NADPH-dependent stearoyl-CoA 9-desaturase
MHILSGHLSFQIEHHLFPDIPSSRYAEMSVRVKDICARHNVPYNSKPMSQQYLSVVKKMYRNSIPGKGGMEISPS